MILWAIATAFLLFVDPPMAFTFVVALFAGILSTELALPDRLLAGWARAKKVAAACRWTII
jgi:hypothetical protein